jgi:tetratricopeptide (TPR) repeat protein
MEPWMLLLGLVAIWIYIFRDRVRARLAPRVEKQDVDPEQQDAGPGPHVRLREFDDDGPTPAIAVTGSGDLLLDCGPMQLVLIVLPKTDASVSADLRWAEAATTAMISTIVVLNRPGPGYLFASAIAERLGLAAGSVFAVDPDAPIDRTPDPVSPPRKAQGLGRGLERGNLRLEPTVDGAVLATWAIVGTPELRVLIGAGIPMASLGRTPHPREVFGSLAAGAPEAFVAGIRAIFETPTLRRVTLLTEVAPGTSDVVTSMLLKLVNVTIAERKDSIVEALEGDDDQLRAALAGRPVDEVARNVEFLATVGRLTEAERLAVSALAVLGPSGRLWFQRGVAAFMAGDTQLAIRSYREAVACDPPHPEAWCNLAWSLASESQLDEALRAADRAIEALPDDPFSIQAGVRIRQQIGNVEGAREFLRAHAAALAPELHARLTEALDQPNPSSPTVIHQFPKGAAALVEVGTAYRERGELERAVEILRRAVVLDPRSHVAAADLGVALSELGRDDEAIAVYDAGIALGLDILRFNRGNAQCRLGRLSAAVDDFRFCLDVAPKWWNARVNLISTLQTLGRFDEAAAQLGELERSDVPADLLEALRQQQMKAPPPDLPAAHSMDTEWFAIDDHGHVAVFDSQETGAVPEAHSRAWEDGPDGPTRWTIHLLEEMLARALPGELRFVADGVFDRRDDPYDESRLCSERDELGDVLDTWRWDGERETSVLLEFDAPRDPVLLAGQLESAAHVLRCEQPLVYVSRVSAVTVYCVWQEIGIVRALLDPPMEPSRFGLFRYVNRDYHHVGYERVSTPMGPALRVESLATGLRRRLAEVRLSGVDFGGTTQLSPSVYLPTRRWWGAEDY